jgi:hypothetical protein
VKIIYKTKSPSAKAKGLGMVRLPLLDTFRTFKGDMIIDNIKLNQLINLPFGLITPLLLFIIFYISIK